MNKKPAKKRAHQKFPLLEVYQADGIKGFACYLATDGEISGAPIIGLNVESLLGTVVLGDVEPRDLPYVVAECIMHEVMHALEQWAKVQFSEKRIEALIEKYRRQVGKV
jgi:hypothetical protein